MQKIQILFPEPQMRRLREAARSQDRPISEVVRRATEAWLDRLPNAFCRDAPRQIPVFHGGRTHVPSEAMRDVAWQDRALLGADAVVE